MRNERASEGGSKSFLGCSAMLCTVRTRKVREKALNLESRYNLLSGDKKRMIAEELDRARIHAI